MSQENVENTRAFADAWNAGDMGAVGESYDPHVVVRYADSWPEGSEPIMGREAVMRQFWRAVGSGPDLNIEATSVTTVRNGKTILVEYFWDRSEALEAVGLSEQDACSDSAPRAHHVPADG
jgi:hypothetical protein